MHRARKRFGQNFLTDGGVVSGIVRALAPDPNMHLIEIGPGLGALTLPLLGQVNHLDVLEIDRDLISYWQDQKQAHSLTGLNIIEGDALEFDFVSWAKQGKDAKRRTCIIGNLPYNISTPILFHLLEHVAVIEDQHFMLQKEVIDRMVASPATSDYGRLSVMLQWRYAMENVLFVPPESFDPPPRVDSAVVRMVPHTAPAPIEPKLLEKLVQVAFSQRRKLLRHTLGAWLTERNFGGTFDVQRRAEEVPVEEYLNLAMALNA
mgnify:CR=1 FL=1